MPRLNAASLLNDEQIVWIKWRVIDGLLLPEIVLNRWGETFYYDVIRLPTGQLFGNVSRLK